MDDEKKGFVFLKSYYLAIKELPDAQRLEVYDAMCKYALDGVMPEDLSGIAKAILCLIQPTIDASQKRWESKVEAGRKGGEAKASKAKQNSSKDLAKSSTSLAESSTDLADGYKDKEKDKDKDKEKERDMDKEEEKETIPPKSPQGDGEKEPSLQERRFEEFWSVYPKRVGKANAWKEWQKLKPNEELCEKIMQSVQDHIERDQDFQRGYIVHPERYLKNRRWEDVLPEQPQERRRTVYDEWMEA